VMAVLSQSILIQVFLQLSSKTTTPLALYSTRMLHRSPHEDLGGVHILDS
jgi:hypothetical protein